MGRCLSQDATWLAKSYSKPQLAFVPSFFYSPFSLSLVFTPSFARSRSISPSLPPAFSNLLPLSLVWYLSVQPLPFAPTSFSPPSFLGCVFLVATHVSLVRFSSLPCVGQAVSSWLGNTLQDVSNEKIIVFNSDHLSMTNKSALQVLLQVFKSYALVPHIPNAKMPKSRRTKARNHQCNLSPFPSSWVCFSKMCTI